MSEHEQDIAEAAGPDEPAEIAEPGQGAGEQHLVVAADEAGGRLDVFLASRLALSRAQVRRLLARGEVRLGDDRVDERAKGWTLEAGTRVSVRAFVHPSQFAIEPEPDLRVERLAEGPGWLVVDKPAGMPVHPFEPDERGSVAGAVIARHPEMHGVGEGGLRSGVVHRLDVETSGALLFALDQRTWERLRSAFRDRRVEKRYRALVLGQPDEAGRVELPLAVVQHKPARVAVVERSRHVGRLAWRVLERFREACLLEVSLETGFLHQIRASLAHRGFPVAGDRTYAAPSVADPTGAGRQMLHSARIAHDEIVAESPDPDDFAALVERLRSGG